MILGLRVVRGPDWNLGDDDGGADHVGTITAVKDDNCVEVLWDMGKTTVCRAGRDQKHDLKIFDSAPIGISHNGVGCEGCEETCISGTRWKCVECENANLCTPCYFDDSHSTFHPFVRIDYPGCETVRLKKRSASQRTRALGLYPNAEVVRGADWEYGDQDGGSDKIGIVEDVVNFGEDLSQRNSVRVRWPNMSTYVYRLGYKGKVDIRCREEAPGADYYPDHLACVDLTKVAHLADASNVLKVGDKVCIEVSKSELRQLQQGRQSWSSRMEELCGEIGVIKSVTLAGDAEIDFDGECVEIDKGAIAKVPKHTKGDSVCVIDSKEKIQMLQRKHGGWDDGMEQVMGKVGKITVIDSDGDVGVTFGNVGFVFHPSCLMPAQAETFLDAQLKNDDTGELSDDEVSETPAEESKKPTAKEGENLDFLQAIAGLMLLQALSRDVQPDIKQVFVQAVAKGNTADVRSMLQEHPELKDSRCNEIPCLCIAAHQGHVGTIRAFLDAGTNINMVDGTGNSALSVALMAEKGDAAKCLIERGADIHLANVQKRTPLHNVALKNMKSLLKLLLDKGCDPNVQDVFGDTPLHDAISERHDDIADTLIQLSNLNVWLKNKKLFNTLAFACLKAHASAVDKLISKEPLLVSGQDTKANAGFYPIHIAAVNNHVNEANILLIKGKANVNAKNDTCLTPLHLAASEGHYDMARLLLTHDADWKLKDALGNTPLHLCMQARRTESMFLQMLGIGSIAEDNERIKIASLLIQHGASLEDKNNLGQTPLTGCNNQRLRDAVQTYAETNKPTKPEPRQTRPRTAKAEQQMSKSSTQKCHKCYDRIADVRFLPCRDLVTCARCSFKYKRCPICGKEISKRVDKDNRPLSGDSCRIC